eukprot:Clim_evm38s203 gene=Clim_evmTU38s203
MASMASRIRAGQSSPSPGDTVGTSPSRLGPQEHAAVEQAEYERGRQADLVAPGERSKPQFDPNQDAELDEISALRRDNHFLRDYVGRLTMELSRYQLKYPPAVTSDEETARKLAEDDATEVPPWLLNKDILAPLFVSYDDRIMSQDQLITELETELQTVLDRAQKVVEERDQLKQETGLNKVKDLEDIISVLREENKALSMEVEALKDPKMNQKISMAEHIMAIEEYRGLLKKLADKYDDDTKTLRGDLTSLGQAVDRLQKEKTVLVQKLAQTVKHADSLYEDLKTTQLAHQRVAHQLWRSQGARRQAENRTSEAVTLLQQMAGAVETSHHEKMQARQKIRELERSAGRYDQEVKDLKNKETQRLGLTLEYVKKQQERYDSDLSMLTQELKRMQLDSNMKSEELKSMLDERKKLEGELDHLYMITDRESKSLRETLLRMETSHDSDRPTR